MNCCYFTKILVIVLDTLLLLFRVDEKFVIFMFTLGV